MNRIIKNFCLFFSILIIGTHTIFGLTPEEIDKLTANLRVGGYGIRQKLLQDQNKHQNQDQEISKKIADEALQNYIKKFGKKSLSPAFAGLMFGIAKATQYEPQARFFPAAAAIPAAEAILGSIAALATGAFLFHKIEHFLNGPALAKFIILEGEMRKNEARIKTLEEKNEGQATEIAHLKEQIAISLKNSQETQNSVEEIKINVNKFEQGNNNLQKLAHEIISKEDKLTHNFQEAIAHLTPQQHAARILESYPSDVFDPAILDNIEFNVKKPEDVLSRSAQSSLNRALPIKNQSPAAAERKATPQPSPTTERNDFPKDIILTEDGHASVENFKRKIKNKNVISNTIKSILGFESKKPKI